jgi:hypothetical protein
MFVLGRRVGEQGAGAVERHGRLLMSQPWGCAPRGLALQRSPFALKALRLERTCASVYCGLGPEPLAQGQSRHLTPTEA